MYATVDKLGQEGSKEGDRRWVHCYKQYAMPMRKMGKVTDKGKGVVASGGQEEELCDDTVRPTYEPKADSNTTRTLQHNSYTSAMSLTYTVLINFSYWHYPISQAC